MIIVVEGPARESLALVHDVGWLPTNISTIFLVPDYGDKTGYVYYIYLINTDVVRMGSDITLASP